MGEDATSGGTAESGSAPPVSVLRPVRAGNGFEETLEQVLQLLRLGLVPPGDRLPAERELAQHLGVSRVTLREVLKVLQDQGMVESRRGRYGGTFVLPRAAAADGSDELRRRVAAVDVEDT
ncbi:GntR family transcriptional regulator, partial [Streptomyces sp. SID2119]|uniref:GntR family transcriptional regulator n=1 Tax=Streptomyces sp. SID2119 TaxID=2690253 RepID=UPI00136C8E1F|nr:GntR family transcriptional regulator [Streptomyces sp. SID2119]